MKREYYTLSKYYDLLHHKKNYQQEAKDFSKLIKRYKIAKGNLLVDLACGSGNHISYLKKDFDVLGVDISKKLIKIAKKKNPDVNFFVDDISKIKFYQKFDVITILFSSISYLSKRKFIKTIKNISKGLNLGGILLIETLFLKDNLKEIKSHIRRYSDKDRNITRKINLTTKRNSAKLEADYEIKERNLPKVLIHDKQKLTLLSKEKITKILEKYGLTTRFRNYKTGTTLILARKEFK